MLFRFSDFINLLFPEVCAACNNGLYRGENILCTRCLYYLPKTNFHLDPDNPLEKAFWGKVHLHSATSLYYFNKGERVQHLVHRLKYHGEREVGHFAGRILGKDLLLTPRFSGVDAVIPVPLHISKLRIRGFNQSESIAGGIAEVMQIPHIRDFLVRNKATATQTRKSRYERFENVHRVFELNPKHQASPRHYLVVDDVITTGSTLTSCCEAIAAIPGAKVSVASLAYARP